MFHLTTKAIAARLPIIARILTVLLSALLYQFCFEPFGWWVLLFPSIVLLLGATVGVSSRKAFYLGLFHGFVSYGLALIWLVNIFAQAAMGLFLLLGVFTGLFCLFNNYFTERAKSPLLLKVLISSVLWCSVEFFRCELFILRFAWITPGTAVGPTWLSPIVGVYGISFVIVFACGCWLNRKTMPAAALLSLMIFVLGIVHMPKVELSDDEGFKVALIQSERSNIDTYLRLTKLVEAEKPELIIWPEYALPYDLRKNAPDFETVRKLCEDMNATIVLGTKTTVNTPAKHWFNTALTMDYSGTLGEYYKARPVPFFNDGMAGKNFTPVVTSLGLAGTPVCFDNDFTAIDRKLTANGAEFFAAINYDSESWSVRQHLQHSALFRIRAAENGRWLACAASSGISQIIDPNGNVHGSIDVMTEGAITGQMARVSQKTFYTMVGWLFPYLMLVTTSAMLLKAAIRLQKEKRAEKLLRQAA